PKNSALSNPATGNPFQHPYVIVDQDLVVIEHFGEVEKCLTEGNHLEGSPLLEVVCPVLKAPLDDCFRLAESENSDQLSVFIPLDDQDHVRLLVAPIPFEVINCHYVVYFQIVSIEQPASMIDHLSTTLQGELGGITSNDTGSLYYQAFHSAPIPLVIAKLDDCTLLEVNEVLLHVIGKTREEVIGQSAVQLGFWTNPKDPERILSWLKERKCVRNLEVSFNLNREEPVNTLLNLDLVDVNGELGVLAIVQDITPIKKAEEKILENEHLLISINENLHEGIYRSTPENGFIYINEAFARMFNLTQEEAIAANPTDLYADASYREYIKHKLAKQGYLKNEEVQFKRKDGSKFWGYLSGLLTKDFKGNVIYDGAIVDISDLKVSKELLREKNQELKKINTELDRFVYSASHDLRAPLSSLLGLVNIAKMENTNSKIEGYLNLMKGSVSKLDGLIKDIIHFSRNARLDVEPELVDFRKIISENIENLQYLPGAKRIQIIKEITGRTDFQSDPKRISILFNNLLSNAIRYHDMAKDEPFIKITVEVEKHKTILEVSDNGRGIEKDYVENIFEMFFRAATDSQGSGLGLYIVKETVEKLKGTISVASKPLVGTTFSIEIPNLAS
ncbi:MAG: sensor histidine kinase, partial [Cyclobacteriaceae bacterium]